MIQECGRGDRRSLKAASGSSTFCIRCTQYLNFCPGIKNWHHSKVIVLRLQKDVADTADGIAG